jgi:hypothetical protein
VTKDNRDRVAARNEPADGWAHVIRDDRWITEFGPKHVFTLSDMEESPDVRVIRVRFEQFDDWVIPPCPSSSDRVQTNEREVNIRVECSEEKTLFDLLYQIIDDEWRLLDILEEKVDFWIKRESDLARLVDIYFSGRDPRTWRR